MRITKSQAARRSLQLRHRIYQLIVRQLIFAIACSVLLPATAMAETVYQTPRDFIFSAFDRDPPRPTILPIEPAEYGAIDRIMDHSRFRHVRVRYWQEGERTAWLFNEIGRAEPITLGVIVNDEKIEKIAILIYREAHGYEVRNNFFTGQFTGATLDENLDLSNTISNIAGATLSVNATRNTARLALYLDKLAERTETPG